MSLDAKEHCYLQCQRCNSLQLLTKSVDLGALYNSGYGSFNRAKKSFLNRVFRRFRNRWAFFRKGGLIGWLCFRYRPLPTDYTIVSKYARRDSTILDIGCGIGNFLDELSDAGFENLIGIDPFLETDNISTNGVHLKKIGVDDFKGVFDLILSHHSFEHVIDPNGFLQASKKLLKSDGKFIITVPIIDQLFDTFGVHTSTIMPPQHTFMYSIKGLERLATANGFQVVEVMREADSYFQWSINSYLLQNQKEVHGRALAPPSVLKELKAAAKRIKASGGGDNVSFVLKMKN